MLKNADQVRAWLHRTDLGKLIAERPVEPTMVQRVIEGVALIAYQEGVVDACASAVELVRTGPAGL